MKIRIDTKYDVGDIVYLNVPEPTLHIVTDINVRSNNDYSYALNSFEEDDDGKFVLSFSGLYDKDDGIYPSYEKALQAYLNDCMRNMNRIHEIVRKEFDNRRKEDSDYGLCAEQIKNS